VRVAIVSSSTVERRLLGELIVERGYRLVDAGGGHRSAADVDVLVLDWADERGALELLRTWTAGVGRRRPYVIALLAEATHREVAAIERVFAAGVDDVLSRPLSRTEILTRLQMVRRVKYWSEWALAMEREGIPISVVRTSLRFVRRDLEAFLGCAELSPATRLDASAAVSAEVDVHRLDRGVECRVKVSLSSRALAELAPLLGATLTVDRTEDLVRELSNVVAGALVSGAEAYGAVLVAGVPFVVSPEHAEPEPGTVHHIALSLSHDLTDVAISVHLPVRATDPAVAHPAETVRDRLRRATRSAHAALERVSHSLLALPTLDAYVGFLRRMYLAQVAFEERLAASRSALAGFGIDVVTRARADDIVRDLVALGFQPPPRRAIDTSWIDDLPSVLGCAYVVEGATLGGQLLEERVGRPLGLGAAHGAAFFHGHGPDTHRLWEELCIALEFGLPDPESQERAVRAAERTLRSFAAVLGGSAMDGAPFDQSLR
jgi:heme oxygenase/DNA-binding response OmpR family regulator